VAEISWKQHLKQREAARIKEQHAQQIETSNFELTLPWPPSDNEHYGHTRHGQIFLSKMTKDFRESVVTRFVLSRQKMMTGPLSIMVECYPPDNTRKRDILNCAKEIGDALQRAGAIKDDYDFWDARFKRMSIFPGGKVVVHIEHLKGDVGTFGF
jgi:Holliday junction resolvase RusA-like endonuclease